MPFISYRQEVIVIDCTKFRVKLTNRCGDIKYLHLNWSSGKILHRGSGAHMCLMSLGQTNVETCNTLCFEQNVQEVTWVLFGKSKFFNNFLSEIPETQHNSVNNSHCMKTGIFISMQHCKLSWNFKFATIQGNLQATPKTDVNWRKLMFVLRKPLV